ncbi:hypothetical protein EYC59_02590 [Candidatus Saccharibacteria bacterium]|nr:MAG: hypothetical protein EYC59_02590 [Candidatus Saccharibacteria bacterium]
MANVEDARANRTRRWVRKAAGVTAVTGVGIALVVGANEGAKAFGIDVQDPASGKMSPDEISKVAEFNHQDKNIYDNDGVAREITIEQQNGGVALSDPNKPHSN